MKTEVAWQFGGWLQSLSPVLAWSILAGAALAGLVVIALLYRRTLRSLPPRPRAVLTTLRIALLLLLLLLLANPSRVQQPEHDAKKTGRNLVVLVDRSGSMDAVDNRRQTRLANALALWKLHTDEAAKNFDSIDYRCFSSAPEKADSLDDAARTGRAGDETQLWKALLTTVDEAPAAIVSLTDGLDTAGEGSGRLVAEAQRLGVPLYFVPGANRSRPTESLSIRDIQTPAQALRLSRFKASAILEIATRRDGQIPVELWSGSRKLASANLPLRAGWNSLPWSAEVTTGEAGAMPLEFRLGTGENRQIAASTTRVVGKTGVSILYYQGALQWGYGFLLGALQSDPSFRVSSILNPALGVQMASATDEHGLTDLPETAAELKSYQIVVLAHVFADQLTAGAAAGAGGLRQGGRRGPFHRAGQRCHRPFRRHEAGGNAAGRV